MTQLNTPYPATAYLTGFLRERGYSCAQADPAIELVLRLLSRTGLARIAEVVSQTRIERTKQESKGDIRKKNRRTQEFTIGDFFLENFAAYEAAVEPVIRFLQGKDPSLALRIVSREFFPEGPRFQAVSQFDQTNEVANQNVSGDEAGGDSLSWAFGGLGVQDRAKYLASLMIDDLVDVIREEIDPRFELSRYGEKLAASAPSFDPIDEALRSEPTLVDEILDEITVEFISKHRPTVLGLTAPFPGNVYGAFRIARKVKLISPTTKIVLGGGYPNTELRELKEPRVFDYMDYVTLDDGERPFLTILENLKNQTGEPQYLRTFVRESGKVVLKTTSKLHDIPHKDSGTPTYDGLPLDKYLSIFEMLNPMHRIWSDGRWNKLTLAHGCYWKKCNFCDVNLDYIGRYDPASADLIVDRIEKIVAETGQSGFHFVDEAAPPALLRQMAERLIARKVTISWWGNVRFEKTFTPELAHLLARSGCVAVSGGLEVASDRLLKLMNKGVTVEQVARVTRALTDAGIMVHAYLMYGFPTQTEQETVDALERVRQLFEADCIQSAYWHRFSTTAHSPIGRDPEKFGIKLLPMPEVTFARNDLLFQDPTPCDHDRLGIGLRKALYNFMHGLGFESDVRFWFDKKVPQVTVPKNLIARALSQNDRYIDNL